MAAFVPCADRGLARKKKLFPVKLSYAPYFTGVVRLGAGPLSEVHGFPWAPLSFPAPVAGRDDSHTEKPFETGKVWPLSPDWGRRVEHPKEGTAL